MKRAGTWPRMHICMRHCHSKRLPRIAGLTRYLVRCHAYYLKIENIRKAWLRWKDIPGDFLLEVWIVSPLAMLTSQITYGAIIMSTV
jgi:hypothetical protein